MTMTQEAVVAEIKADLETLKTQIAAKDSEIASLTTDKASLTQQISDLNAKVTATDNVSPDLESTVGELHAFAQSIAPAGGQSAASGAALSDPAS